MSSLFHIRVGNGNINPTYIVSNKVAVIVLNIKKPAVIKIRRWVNQ